MSNLLDSLKEDGGGWLDAEDCYWQDRMGYVMHTLDFCGCGLPESAATYIRDGLQALAAYWETVRKEPRLGTVPVEVWREFEAHWPDEGSRYFFWYWLDAQKLTEHGGSVPGWLTDKGEDYLAALNEVLAEEALGAGIG